MRECQDCPVGHAFLQLRWLSEVIRHQHSLAVSRHQGMDRAKQHGGRYGTKNGSRVATSNLPKAARHSNDYEWSIISSMLPNKPRLPGWKTDVFSTGIFWLLPSAPPWRD